MLHRHAQRAAKTGAAQRVGHRGVRDPVIVAPLAEMRQHYVHQVAVHHVAREIGARPVGQVPGARGDPRLEEGRVGSGPQHPLVVVGLEHEQVGARAEGAYGFARVPTSVHTTATTPVSAHVSRTPMGLAASCGVACTLRVVRESDTLAPGATRVQGATWRSAQAATVPSLAYRVQPHFRAPAAAPFT